MTLSHSYLNNRNLKYHDNDESSEDNLTLRLRSVEQETKLRMENTSTWNLWKLNAGVELNYSQYSNTTYQRVFTDEVQIFDYRTNLDIFRLGTFLLQWIIQLQTSVLLHHLEFVQMGIIITTR